MTSAFEASLAVSAVLGCLVGAAVKGTVFSVTRSLSKKTLFFDQNKTNLSLIKKAHIVSLK